MTDKGSPFTKEDLRLLLNLSGRLIFNQASRIGAGIKQEIKNKFNSDIRFSRALKAKYDALVAAGFIESQAFELALKAVEETLKQTIGQANNPEGKNG